MPSYDEIDTRKEEKKTDYLATIVCKQKKETVLFTSARVWLQIYVTWSGMLFVNFYIIYLLHDRNR